MMYLAHDAFRRDLRLLTLASTNWPRSGDSLRTRWGIFTRQLEIHHRAEDDALWPQFDGKALSSTEVAVLEAMRAEHAQIDPLLEELDDALTDGDDDRFSAGLRDLTEALTQHMRHEEDQALPLVERFLGPQGWGSFAASIRKRQGMKGAAEFFPWLLEDAPDPTRDQVLALVPPPVRILYRRVWAPRYARGLRAVSSISGQRQ
jgi:hemerythrin superfamily protein